MAFSDVLTKAPKKKEKIQPLDFAVTIDGVATPIRKCLSMLLKDIQAEARTWQGAVDDYSKHATDKMRAGLTELAAEIGWIIPEKKPRKKHKA